MRALPEQSARDTARVKRALAASWMEAGYVAADRDAPLSPWLVRLTPY